MDRPIIFNYGGGKQSVAICVLIRQEILPRPERIVVAHTGREVQSTWDYLEQYTRPLMREIGCEIEVIPHSFAKQDLYYVPKEGERKSLPVMPVWTRQNDGKLGKLPTFCSGFWKRDVVAAWLKMPESGYGRKNPVIQWLGFSVDEISRVKPSGVKWREHHFPLIMGYGLQMNRQDCIKTILDYGLPEPKKSRCYMCPEQTNEEWREIKENPIEWEKAIDLDYEVRSNDKDNSIFLHRSGVPLIDADLSDKAQPLFDYAGIQCASNCWT